jgi:hypothetical protein
MQANKIVRVLSAKKVVLGVFIAFSLIASLQAFFAPKKTYTEGGLEYNRYNNYTIFERSFHHLKNGQDLYVLYPEEQFDLYKYSPTFAVFFGFFAVFPDVVGLTFWTLLNSLILFFSIYYLKGISEKGKGLLLLLGVFEMLTSLQNTQSNGLMAGLLIFAYGFMERKQIIWATLFLVFSVYIKLFGLVGFALFLFYPDKLRFILYSIFWSIVLFLLPLMFVDLSQYKFLLQSWGEMLAADHSASYGMSVMGWLHAWFNWNGNKLLVVLIGVLIFLFPFVKLKNYVSPEFRMKLLVSILIWIVIFNHKAESPTFVIAFSGVGIWYFMRERSKLDLALFIFAFLFTTLSSTDLFPKTIRKEFVDPYQLKVFPVILIWIKLIYEMMVFEVKQKTVKVQ